MSTGNSTNPASAGLREPQDIGTLSAVELSNGYERRDISPVEVARTILRRVQVLNRTLNAFCFVDEEDVLSQAHASEARWRHGGALGALDGVPVSVKDNIQATGTPTLFGSRVLDRDASFLPDSPAVARLREAGAVILGKTTMPEFAYKVTTESPLTGITVNPWDLDHSPGGSSGGAAAAVAAGLGPLALGTDGGGSIRVPAAWCGIFGFKPSFGRVPHYPRGTFALLSHVGPMTRTVADAALMMQAITRPDARDWYSLPPDTTDYPGEIGAGVAGMTIAVSPTMGLADVGIDPEIADAVTRAAALLADHGAMIVEADPPAVETCRKLHVVMWSSYCAAVVRHVPDEKRRAFDPGLMQLAELGESLPRNAFLEAIAARAEIGCEVNNFFSQYDLLLGPASPILAPPAPWLPDSAPIVPFLTSWCNQTGLPAASVPMGIGLRKLPLAVQLIGPRFSDISVLRASRILEASQPPMPFPPVSSAEQTGPSQSRARC